MAYSDNIIDHLYTNNDAQQLSGVLGRLVQLRHRLLFGTGNHLRRVARESAVIDLLEFLELLKVVVLGLQVGHKGHEHDGRGEREYVAGNSDGEAGQRSDRHLAILLVGNADPGADAEQRGDDGQDRDSVLLCLSQKSMQALGKTAPSMMMLMAVTIKVTEKPA